jgi:DNA-binding CsgD family transcriptional regulator
MRGMSLFPTEQVVETIDDQQLSDLIGEIYDAALDQSRWASVLEKCVAFVGGCAAALFFKDAAANRGDTYFETGISPYYRNLYFDEYVTLDPATKSHFHAEIEQPVATTDFMPYDEFLQTRFYREWVQPQGLVDFVSTVLDKSATSVVMFGVFRHERDGIANDDTRQRMRLIAPHIRRAVVLGRLIDLKHTDAKSFEILDSLGTAIFLVGSDGFIVHSNLVANSMLDDGGLLQSVGGRLVVEDVRISEAMREGFASACEGDTAMGVKAIAVPLIARNGERYVGHLLPLTSGVRRRATLQYGAVAALFVRKVALEMPLTAEVIAKAFNLTPTELRVLLAVVEVGGAPEVAAMLGIAVSTVKTHLVRLFHKTGVTRQADLVKLVAGYSTPFAR